MLRVLLIDDHPDDRTLVIRQLQHEFDEVEIEQIIDQASFDQALKAKRFDIAITDYRLLWNDGLTVLRQLKVACPICPVIMFTNSAMQEEAIEAMKAGLDDYIIKSPRHYIRLATATRLALERAADRHKANHLEMRLQGLLNHLHVGVFRATLDGHLLEANDTFLDLLGVQTLTEAQALNLHEWFSLPHASFPEPSQLLESSSSQSLIEQWLEREVQLQPLQGEPRWIALNQTITAFGQEFFIEGLIQDISNRKALETALWHQTQALAQTNRLKDEFLLTLYHELRTPLSPILGWAKVLRGQSRYDKPLFDRALETIERNAVKQTHLIDDVLDISQVIQGRLQLNPTLVNLGEITAVVVERIRAALESKSIELSVELDPNLGLVWGDKNRLQQILWNLLLNAVKFTPSAGQIHVRLVQHQTVIFQVQDTGIGISPEFLPHAFDRFSQADGSTTRIHGGMGLGLAIVRHLVELHGGTVKAESPGVGEGATFTVELPVATARKEANRKLMV
jgi:signal transduction histidine kinase